jgi:hypothetical protein
LVGGEGSDRRENAVVDCSTVVEQRANHLLEGLNLGSSSRGRGIGRSLLRPAFAIRGRNIDGGRFSRGRRIGGADRREKVRDVPRHGEGESTGGTVMCHRKPQVLGTDGGGRDRIEGGERGEEVVKVLPPPVLYPEVIDDEGKSNGAGDMTEKHGGGGLMVAMRPEVGEEAELGQEAGLGEARDALADIRKNKRATVTVGLEERGETHFLEQGEGVDGGVEGDADRRDVPIGERGTVVKLVNVHRPEERILGNDGVEQKFYDGELRSLRGTPVGDRDTVAPRRPTDTPNHRPLGRAHLLLHHVFDVRGVGGGGVRGHEALRADKEEAEVIGRSLPPLLSVGPGHGTGKLEGTPTLV